MMGDDCPTIPFLEGMKEEALRWNRRLLSDPAGAGGMDGYDVRLHIRELDLDLQALIGDHPVVRLVDVGSGPLTSLGTILPGRQLVVVATDVYGDEYAGLMDDLGLVPLVRPVGCRGEDLLHRFGPGGIDLAYSENALDHCENPVKVLDAMVAIVRSGGAVVVKAWKDEGEAAGYRDMHAWNLTVDDGGHLVLWRGVPPEYRCDLMERYREQLSWAYNSLVGCGRGRLRVVSKMIKKG